MQKFHAVKDVILSDTEMFLTIDEKQYSFKLSDISSKLQNATQQERNTFTISTSGYGIHWPLLDEDLSIDGLLGIKHEPKRINKYAKDRT
ncbi:MAG: DUF2442 domain-containing protein [Candidatus Jettenia caeni]|nr:DUF2442 domain-containing protein [Candidatus Jettenia caeni]UJS17086.1 MAG: DUF2442 domain-containing protein [Candidatus Jettenia sp.]